MTRRVVVVGLGYIYVIYPRYGRYQVIQFNGGSFELMLRRQASILLGLWGRLSSDRLLAPPLAGPHSVARKGEERNSDAIDVTVTVENVILCHTDTQCR